MIKRKIQLRNVKWKRTKKRNAQKTLARQTYTFKYPNRLTRFETINADCKRCDQCIFIFCSHFFAYLNLLSNHNHSHHAIPVWCDWLLFIYRFKSFMKMWWFHYQWSLSSLGIERIHKTTKSIFAKIFVDEHYHTSITALFVDIILFRSIFFFFCSSLKCDEWNELRICFRIGDFGCHLLIKIPLFHKYFRYLCELNNFVSLGFCGICEKFFGFGRCL